MSGITIKKDEDFSEWFTQLMKEAELADVRYNIKGFPVYLPWATKSIRKITRIWENALENHGHEPLMLPVLIPEANFHKEADHVEGFTPEVFWVSSAGSKTFDERFALRPTSETAMYDMFAKWIRSYKDLPFKRYQTCTVYRYETKMTRPFMRTRELYWSESHNVFATHEDAIDQVREDMKITQENLYEKLALPHIFFKRPQWDVFPGAENTYAADVLLPSGKVLQLPSTHVIKQSFAKAFEIKYVDQTGKEQFGWTTCYGPCHSRNYGALITFHGDDTGLVIPWDVSPAHVVITPIFKKDNKEMVLAKAQEIKDSLAGYDVILDDSETSPGWKFNQWEMKGVPARIEIGPKDIEKNQVVIFRRDIGEKQTVSMDAIGDAIAHIKDTYTANMKKKADTVFETRLKESDDKSEIGKHLKEGFMVRTSFCSIDKDGEPCAEILEKEFGGEVRGEWFDKNEKPFCKCPVCGKDSKSVVYIAKSH